jgi:putative ubiquitin-RnfH superfamily antitoxin RatB of RatAB toxin-antitoxin module
MSRIRVSVVYALPDHQEIVEVFCASGTTIRGAIELSRICDQYPDIDLGNQEVGVYGLKQSLDYEIVDNDRVEIYRPLIISPTEARRLRAKSKQNP